MISLRSNRAVLLGFVALLLGTLYFFYPSDHFRSPHTPQDPYGTYEAGGIDSDHWREPVVPHFEKELARDEELCTEGECKVEPKAERPVKPSEGKAQAALDGTKGVKPSLDEAVLTGGVIMPKLENATANMASATSNDPEVSRDDRETLKSYFHLFARLYPCGECAEEFQSLLKQYPPQTSSRKTASMWLCSVHNIINERLGKEEFDCLTLNDVYDCGCGPEGEESKDAADVKTVGEAAVAKGGDGKEKGEGEAVEKKGRVPDKVLPPVEATVKGVVDMSSEDEADEDEMEDNEG